MTLPRRRTAVSSEALTISALARLAGVNVETVRFYERQHLIPDPPRGSGGRRRYPPETIERISFIRRTKALGFSLSEIRDLLSLRSAERVQPAEKTNSVHAAIAKIEEKIQTLMAIRTALHELKTKPDADNRISPLLAILDAHQFNGK